MSPALIKSTFPRSGVVVPSMTHQSFTQVCFSGHRGSAAEHFHMRSSRLFLKARHQSQHGQDDDAHVTTPLF
jgi:hypothetical protein